MASHLISLFIFFVVITVLSVNANHCEGEYTTDVPKILQEMDKEKSTWSEINNTLKRVGFIKNNASFKDICRECDRWQKLSICVKALQHKLKTSKPKLFTVNPLESNYFCFTAKVHGENNKTYDQQMYLCPATTFKFVGLDNITRSRTEPQFLIGQGLHSTQHRVRIFSFCHEDTVYVEGQLTGFSLDKWSHKLTSCGNYDYTPVYESENAESASSIVPFRETGNMADSFEIDRDCASSSESEKRPLLG